MKGNRIMEKREDKVFSRDKLINVKINSDGCATDIFFDGKKVPNVIAFSIQQNAQEKRVVELTLRVQCKLDLSTGIVPSLPEPWCWYYKPNNENFVDPRNL